MIGHKKIIEDFKNLVSHDALGHGYIFVGSSMVGKKTMALALGKFLEKNIFEVQNSEEVLHDIMLIDGAYMKLLNPDTHDSIGIDAVREIKNFLWQKPNVSSRRTLIIDNAELLTTEAQNALLKITEEPPVSSLLILITSDSESILPTIVSRLPKIYFGTVPEKEITAWVSDAAIAKRSLGKPGLAWRLMNDESFNEALKTAEQFLKTTSTNRKDFIKMILDPDDFSLRVFLDAVIITLAWEKPTKAKAQFWHKALKLYENANDFSLNPRLQLESLMK